MKKLLLGALMSSIFCFGGIVTKYENLALKDDVFQIFETGQKFLDVGFNVDESFWSGAQADNWQSRLTITRGATLHDRNCLLVEGGKPRKIINAAWSLCSVNIPYTGKPRRVAINVSCCTDMFLQSISGKNYNSYVVWLDGEGRWISQTPLQLGGWKDSFYDCQAVGEVPEGTKYFYILFGFHQPNVKPGQFCAFSRLTMSWLDETPKYVDKGYFETYSVKLEKKAISWKGKIPEGTGIYVQASLADDVDGCPGDWSTFAGPDGKSDAYYDKPFTVSKPWVRLRVEMRCKGTSRPELEELVFGDTVEKYWKTTSILQEPVIENLTESPTLNRRVPIVLRMSCANAPIKWSTFTATLDGKDVTARFVRNGDTVTYSTGEDYADGRHELKVHIENNNGRAIDSSKLFTIGESPKVDKITLRDDGMTLINGKPFFPIGAYGVAPREFNGKNLDKAFKDLSEAGFNFVHTYGAFSKEFLDGAHKYGMRVWARVHDFKELNDLKLHHPAVLAWYIGDDTSDFTTPARLQDLGDALRAVDGKRVTTQADGAGTTKHVAGPMDFVCLYQCFMRATDNFLPEIYPVRKDTQEDRESSVPIVIRDTVSCIDAINAVRTGKPKSVWSIIQFFDGYENWKRFPTEDELRAMSYVTIVHGATGITWYTYGGYGDNHGMTSTPERWAAMTRLTSELRELTPVLVERKPADQPSVTILSGKATDALGYPSISCLMKRHDGETYIIAVNSSLDTVTASFSVPGVNGGTAMFEKQPVRIDNGILTAEFAPYAVHIFRLK